MPLPEMATEEMYFKELEAVRSSVSEDIASEEQKQTTLLAYNEKLHYTGLFILAALLINIIFLIFLPRYMLYWIISSFILYMVNPFILMIPTNRTKATLPDMKTITEFAGVLRDIGVAKESRTDMTKTIGKVLWDAFFINSQPLAIGFGIIYGLDILFSLHSGFIGGNLDRVAAVLITLQSLAIIIFYAVIWHIKPYNPRFFNSLVGMGQDARKKIRTGWRQGLRVVLFIGALAAVSGILVISAMLLPGMTLNTFLDSIDYSLGWNLLPIILIFLSQVVIARYLQGAYSKELLLQIGDNKIHIFRDRILHRLTELPQTPQEIENPGHLDTLMTEIESLSVAYLRMKVYKADYHDLFGLFPVYLVVPDLHLILDRDAVTVTKSTRMTGQQQKLTAELSDQPPIRSNQ
ncbi:hypothetical protein ABH15_06290 [Methanoculleus taiwanensis]|uniref:Uncharacterized protein n=2 Tax=Methanoculleus taiwanensis TaxID=1550565 RepID=A0A498H1D4_9EURY|nr:hypothetical protein ABH15_06290 [Methanoculleus taiwanensis]